MPTTDSILDDDELDTILAVARDHLSGRITASQIAEMVRGYKECARLRERIARAEKQLAVAAQYEKDENGMTVMPSVWRLQNGLIRSALRGD